MGRSALASLLPQAQRPSIQIAIQQINPSIEFNFNFDKLERKEMGR